MLLKVVNCSVNVKIVLRSSVQGPAGPGSIFVRSLAICIRRLKNPKGYPPKGMLVVMHQQGSQEQERVIVTVIFMMQSRQS